MKLKGDARLSTEGEGISNIQQGISNAQVSRRPRGVDDSMIKNGRTTLLAALIVVGAVFAGESVTNSTSLKIAGVVRNPLVFVWKGQDLPVGTNIGGYVVEKVTHTNAALARDASNTGLVDRSELTLRKGEEAITLLKGVPFARTEYQVHIATGSAKESIVVTPGNTFAVGGRTFLLLRINSAEAGAESCTVVDVDSKQELDVKR